MGDPTPINKTNEANGEGADPKKPVTPPAESNDGQLSDEAFQKVFDDPRLWTHPRFKELNQRAGKAAEYEKQQKEQEEKTLQEQGKLKELADLREKERNEALEKLNNVLLEQKIQIAAQKAGAVDLEAVVKLIDRAGITIDKDGGITGIDEAVKKLLSEKKYLATGNSTVIGNGTNPGDPGTPAAKRFKLSQLQDTVFYKEHEAEIALAYKAGTIENDLAH
jgi:hypothetical protein